MLEQMPLDSIKQDVILKAIKDYSDFIVKYWLRRVNPNHNLVLTSDNLIIMIILIYFINLINLLPIIHKMHKFVVPFIGSTII